MKFCGNCGAKVHPGNCWNCNSELLVNAKFCIECGSPAKKPAPPAVVATPVEAAAPSTSSEAAAPQDAVDDSVPVVTELPAGSPVAATAALAGGADSSPSKRPFSVRQSPKCAVCAKSVYETEKAMDSSGTVFHKDCFRCKTCKVYLNGRQRMMEPDVGSLKIANGQYLVAREGSRLGDAGDFFCDKHTIKAGADVVKAQVIDEKARDDAELERVASLRRDANEEARISMQVRVGDMLPQCSRCGRPIDRGQRAITSGIEKMHESCPTQEESDRAIRPARWFVRRAPERVAGTLTCDKETKHPHTFLYELEKTTFVEALKKQSHESVKLVYTPDLTAHSGAQRKLVAPSSDATRQFDFHFKDYLNFGFEDHKNEGKVQEPHLDKSAQTLLVRKFHLTNGVLQTMEVVFKYDEETQLCTAERVELGFEMWPPEVAAEMKADLDPLANLKAQRE